MFEVTRRGITRPVSSPAQLAGGGTWQIAEEVPIALSYNRRNYAVIMGTPDDLVDFAAGFSLTEEVVKSVSEIISLDIILSDKGADLRFKISDDALERLDITARRRNMVGSASCGLCGLENADTLFKALPQVSPPEISLPAVSVALAMLREKQPLNAKTRTVHAAGWSDLSGQIIMTREDVGRHSALDKLLGAMALEGMDTAAGFVVMSSRCSYEIIEKAAKRGVGALASISAPTGFALRKAAEAGMAVYAQAEHQAIKLL